jgi:hypothetical protein
MNRRAFLACGSGAALVAAAGLRAETIGPSGWVFGIIADVQYADVVPEGERHYRESLPKLTAALEDLAAHSAAFVLHLGDVIDRDFGSFARVLPLFARSRLPVHHILGNHDYSLADPEKARVPSTLGMPHDYYTLLAPGLRFLMLDTTETAAYKHPANSPAAQHATEALARLATAAVPSAKPWNGGVSERQLAWIDRELSAADAAREPVILCGHHPLLPAESHQLWNAEDLLTVIDRHPSVAAYFNGHRHVGDSVVRNQIPYITFRSLLHEPGVSAYTLVRVHANRLVLEGRGREPSREIPLGNTGR